MPNRVVDLLTVELHQGDALSGGITAERTFLMRGRISLGAASIRGDLLNAGRHGEGTRMLLAGRVPLPDPWSATLSFTQAFSEGRNADPRTRLDLGLSWR